MNSLPKCHTELDSGSKEYVLEITDQVRNDNKVHHPEFVAKLHPKHHPKCPPELDSGSLEYAIKITNQVRNDNKVHHPEFIARRHPEFISGSRVNHKDYGSSP